MTSPMRAGETPAQQGTELPTAPPSSALTGSVQSSELPSLPRHYLDTELTGTFGRYEIVRLLGGGGMGLVYLARDTLLPRLVALKVPRLHGPGQQMVRERFHREARAAAVLHHPNICPVYDVGQVGDLPYLTMAYIEGQTFADWAKDKPIPVLLIALAKIAQALHEAHRHGIVHRDLKSSNVMIDQRGEPIVMDFGLARRLQADDGSRITELGQILGTPAYMSPEQVECKDEVGPASDIYSLGVLLYEVLARRLPFTGPSTSLFVQIVTTTPPPPSHWQPTLDPRLDAICQRAMSRRPEDRFASMVEFAQALQAVLGDSPSSSTPAQITPMPQPAPTVQKEPPDPRMAGRILDMLRTWGWARSIQRMRNRAQRADNPRQRVAYESFLTWIIGERSDDTITALPEGRALQGWSLAGQASHRLRERDYSGAVRLLDQATACAEADDPALLATIAHTRGVSLVHRGQCDAALPHLHRALDLFGRGHFMVGRVLDTLGMAYAYKGNFPIAREFYQQSIRCKQAFDDESGLAISHGQLGRLHLDWGHLDAAEQHFNEDIRLAQRLRSQGSEAQLYNHLGQVDLARGEREAAAGKREAARRHYVRAAGWLEQSIRLAKANNLSIAEGYARKDRALVYLREGNLVAAEEQIRLAGERFADSQFTEGQAKLYLVEGILLRQREQWTDAERRFRAALTHFEATQEADAAVRALWEIARTLRDSGTAAPLVTSAYRDALARAEQCRHDPLIRGIEAELHEVDLEAYLRHVYRRARGTGIDDDSPSLVESISEVGTVLSVELPGFHEFSRGLDPEDLLVTFNHLLADFTDVLTRHKADVLAYRSNGLLALTRDTRHARNAVAAALGLVQVLEEFNRPRRLLELPIFQVQIGLCSGDVLLGNVGTYRKMDFTAIGPTVNLAAALRSAGQPGLPCLSRSTWEQLREPFSFTTDSPRTVQVPGFGAVEVWDVQPEAK